MNTKTISNVMRELAKRRVQALTPKRRQAIARQAAQARWHVKGHAAKRGQRKGR